MLLRRQGLTQWQLALLLSVLLKVSRIEWRIKLPNHKRSIPNLEMGFFQEQTVKVHEARHRAQSVKEVNLVEGKTIKYLGHQWCRDISLIQLRPDNSLEESVPLHSHGTLKTSAASECVQCKLIIKNRAVRTGAAINITISDDWSDQGSKVEHRGGGSMGAL